MKTCIIELSQHPLVTARHHRHMRLGLTRQGQDRALVQGKPEQREDDSINGTHYHVT